MKMYEKMILTITGLTVPLLIVAFITFGIAWIYGSKLFLCIKKNYPARYQYLYGNALEGYGDPINNFLIIWRYVYNNLDEEEEVIKDCKIKLRKCWTIALITSIPAVILLIVEFLLISLGGHWD